jgi:hypothetical protein
MTRDFDPEKERYGDGLRLRLVLFIAWLVIYGSRIFIIKWELQLRYWEFIFGLGRLHQTAPWLSFFNSTCLDPAALLFGLGGLDIYFVLALPV